MVDGREMVVEELRGDKARDVLCCKQMNRPLIGDLFFHARGPASLRSRGIAISLSRRYHADGDS